MPEYRTPGVYIEEIESGPKPIEGVSTSTVGFLGETERGPTLPRFITSFEAFYRTYGDFIPNSFLAYSVDGFFRNGGKRCYVARIVGENSQNSKISIGAGDKTITIRACGPGIWGNRIQYRIQDSSLFDETNYFKLELLYYSKKDKQKLDDSKSEDEKSENATLFEVYENCCTDPKSSYFYKTQINGISNLIEVEDDYSDLPGLDELPSLEVSRVETFTPLEGGTDGEPITQQQYQGSINVNDPKDKRGLIAFEDIEEISILTVPDQGNVPEIADAMISHCEKLKDRFAIIQCKQNDIGNIGNPNTILGKLNSKYGAIYFPWLEVFDPLTKDKRLVPPGGHIAGIYARSDTERGVHKAPANENVRGVSKLQIQINKEQQGNLNPKGINVIRTFPGRGIIVWGARTLSTDPSWKYVNVRRLFIFIEKSVERHTQWAVFEPNNERLWSRIKSTLTNFLTSVWKTGALMGTTPEEGFFVVCDRTVMTQNDLDNGRLIVIVGIAPTKPAEFVIFRFTQTRAGAKFEEA